MNISEMLNPSFANMATPRQLSSPPLSPKSDTSDSSNTRLFQVNSKPRSRFSDLEDTIICEGVAKGLTWGQISRQLPHRKRATCFNRYRTLQGIRKSRKRTSDDTHSLESPRHMPPVTPSSPDSLSPLPSLSSSPWLPATPSPSSLSAAADPAGFKCALPSTQHILLTDNNQKEVLFPYYRSTDDHQRDMDHHAMPVRLAPLRSFRLSTNVH